MSFQFSLTDGKNIAKIFKKTIDGDKFIAYLKYIEEEDDLADTSSDSDDELGEIIRKSKLDANDKSKLEKIIRSKIRKSTEPNAQSPNFLKTFANKYFHKNRTELILPPNHFIKQIHIPSPGSERASFYIPGKSNSGKTTWIADYILDYLDQYPKNEILLFTGIPKEEPAFEAFKDKVKIMDLEQFRDDPNIANEDMRDLQDTLCIFDDVNSLPDLKTKKAIIALRDMILQGGRHFNITCMCTSHNALDRNLTIYPIKESDKYVVFPSRNKPQTRALLTKYGELTKENLDKLMSLNTRWVEINLDSPPFVIYQRGAYFL